MSIFESEAMLPTFMLPWPPEGCLPSMAVMCTTEELMQGCQQSDMQLEESHVVQISEERKLKKTCRAISGWLIIVHN